MKAKERFNSQEWAQRHNDAVERPAYRQEIIVGMIDSWVKYAKSHERSFDSKVGDDGVLGPEWEAIGDALRGLLNGEVGPRLDCGTLDSFIYDTMEKNAVDMDGK